MNQRRIGILISYLNIVLHAVVGFLYVPLLLHYIGKSEYGLYQLIGSLIAYFSVMDFGLTAAVVRFYSKYKALKDNIGMENILAISLRAYACISVVLLVVGTICYCNINTIFHNSMTPSEIDSAKKLFILLLFNIAITMSTMVFKSVINAHEKYLFLKGLETIQLIMQPVLVILVLQKYPSAFSVALVQTGLNILLNSSRIYYCFYGLRIKIKFHYWDKALFHDFSKLALSVFAVSIIDQIFFKTNQIILGIISGTFAVAVYSLASLIYMNYMALSTAISGVYLPHVTGLIAQGDYKDKLSNLFIRIGRLQYFLLGLVGSGFIIFGQQFISIWAGTGFESAYWMTLLIIIPFTIDLIQNIGLSIMQAMNKYDFRAKVYLSMGIFNLMLAVPLAKLYGGVGCAFATGLSMFIGNGLIMNWFYARVIELDIAEFWKQIAKISIGVVILTTVGYIVNFIFVSNNTVFFIIKILCYTLIYGIVMYKYFINNDEKGRFLKRNKR